MAGMSSNKKRPADGLSRQTVPKNAAQCTITRAGAQVVTREGKGEGEADGPLAYEDIMDPRRDAVGLALAALRIPRVNVREGKLFNNARILRWTLVAHLDAPYRGRLEVARLHRRELRFRQALYALRNYPALQKTLHAIRRFRRREKKFSALKIRRETYRKRFSDLTKILKSRLVIQRAVMIGNVPADEPHNEQRLAEDGSPHHAGVGRGVPPSRQTKKKAQNNEQSNTGHKRER